MVGHPKSKPPLVLLEHIRQSGLDQTNLQFTQDTGLLVSQNLCCFAAAEAYRLYPLLVGLRHDFTVFKHSDLRLDRAVHLHISECQVLFLRQMRVKVRNERHRGAPVDLLI